MAELSVQQRASGTATISLTIFLLALAVHWPWLGIAPIAGTEGHRIFPAEAMVRSGWWSVPRLFGCVYLAKPPLHYWLIALSQTIFGHGNVTIWRLPSLLTGALTCAACGGFAVRWFGRTAGWISGFCALGLLCLWGQDHVADIDSTNTLAAALSAFCGVQLLLVDSSCRRSWSLYAGLAIGATLMTKGPGGLPIILAIWLCSAAINAKTERPGPLSPSWWVPWLISVALCAIWIATAYHAMKVRGMPVDLRGVREGADSSHPHSLAAFVKSFTTLPPQLFAFSLPVSLVLPLAFVPLVRRGLEDQTRRLVTALSSSVLLSWGICVATAMTNPRYGYPTLLPLCPLAGAIAVELSRGNLTRHWLGAWASASAVMFLAASIVLAKLGWKTTWGKPILIATISMELVLVIWTILTLRRSWYGGWGLAMLVLLTVFPFSIHEQIARIATSGVSVAPKLQSIIGPGGPLAVGGAVTSKPEAFYYSGVDFHFYKTNFDPNDVPPGTWVVMDPAERKLWTKSPRVKLTGERFLCKWGNTPYTIAWYEK